VLNYTSAHFPTQVKGQHHEGLDELHGPPSVDGKEMGQSFAKDFPGTVPVAAKETPYLQTQADGQTTTG
jgi:hypothetical protein